MDKYSDDCPDDCACYWCVEKREEKKQKEIWLPEHEAIKKWVIGKLENMNDLMLVIKREGGRRRWTLMEYKAFHRDRDDLMMMIHQWEMVFVIGGIWPPEEEAKKEREEQKKDEDNTSQPTAMKFDSGDDDELE